MVIKTIDFVIQLGMMFYMAKLLGIRFSDEEQALLEKAVEQTAEPGDRGGLSAWARRAILKEAQRVLGKETSS